MGRRRKVGRKKAAVKPAPASIKVTKDEVEECEVDEIKTDKVDDSYCSVLDSDLDDPVLETEEGKKKSEDLDKKKSADIMKKGQPDLMSCHTAETQRIELADDSCSSTDVEEFTQDITVVQEQEKKVVAPEEQVEIPEVLSTLGLTVSPSSKSKNRSSSPTSSENSANQDAKTFEEKQEPGTSKEAESAETSKENQEAGTSEDTKMQEENSAPVGKLRSSVADAEGHLLAKGYRHRLRETEEYALNYMCKELHHPVISCFRELTKSDISTVVGNRKFKKSCNSLELSVVYLGLIDLLAVVNNNPLYNGENTLFNNKTVSNHVQKILLEFKSIIGLWALSGSESLNNRYVLILRYLRALVPMFKKAEFEEKFGSILDCIEKEVKRCKMNQEKLKSMSSTSGVAVASENSGDKKISLDSQDGDFRSALNEIILNVNLTGEDEDSDLEGMKLRNEENAPQIFGKPLKASPKTSSGTKRPRKPKNSTDTLSKDSPKSSGNLKKNENNVVKTPTSHKPVKSNSLPKPKTLSSVFQSSSSSTSSKNTNKTAPVKRNAEELTNSNETTKKIKLDESSDPVVSKEEKGIKNFFQTKNTSPVTDSSDKETAKEPVTASNVSAPKPAINAFAFMMNRSREMAQKKKLDKSSTPKRPAVKT